MMPHYPWIFPAKEMIDLVLPRAWTVMTPTMTIMFKEMADCLIWKHNLVRQRDEDEQVLQQPHLAESSLQLGALPPPQQHHRVTNPATSLNRRIYLILRPFPFKAASSAKFPFPELNIIVASRRIKVARLPSNPTP
jgi:hypothetical protein